MDFYYCRIGCRGEIGVFRSLCDHRAARGERVICQDQMGLWTATVLGSVTSDAEGDAPSERGVLLRRMTAEDHLLEQRLRQGRTTAITNCQQLIDARSLPVTLLDVDHLFDGRTLLFYFAGDVTAEVQSLADELVTIYEAEVATERFAELLEAGCGPGCGTDAGQGCGSACAGCVVAKACRTTSPS